jgi:hypothetical protein
MKRIYCKECKYHEYRESDYGFWHICIHKNSKVMNRNSITEWATHKECAERNKNNNCHDYKKRETLWDIVSAYFR